MIRIRTLHAVAGLLALSPLMLGHPALQQPVPAATVKIGDLVMVEYEGTAIREEAKKREPATGVYMTTISLWVYGTLTQAGPDFVTVSSGYYRWSDGYTYDTRHYTIARKAVRKVTTLKPDQVVTLPGLPPATTPPATTLKP